MLRALLIIALLVCVLFLLQNFRLEASTTDPLTSALSSSSNSDGTADSSPRGNHIRFSKPHESTRSELWNLYQCDAYFKSNRPASHDAIWKRMHQAYNTAMNNSSFIDNLHKAILVPYSVKSAGKKGLGVFADKFIPKGTLVSDYRQHGRVLFKNGNDFRQFVHDHVRRQESCIALQCSGVELHKPVGAVIATYLDDSCFVNHGKEPNVGCSGDCGSFDHEYALRDIQAGEEILCSYEIYHVVGWDKFTL